MASPTALRALRQLIFANQLSKSRSGICSSCRQALQSHSRKPQLSLSRTSHFSTTSDLSKKSSGSVKSNRKSPEIKNEKSGQSVPDNPKTRTQDEEIDPYDQSELQKGIDTALARLKEALVKTRDAGRVSTDMIEALPVEINVKHPDQSQPKGKSQTAHHEGARIGDIASVVPKGGRTLQIFAAEEAHVKPITASVMASEYSLNPEVDQNNNLLVIVPVPPATQETRAQAAEAAKKMGEKAATEVRNARGAAQKRYRKMEMQKLVIKDELHKAHKVMEDVAKKGQDEVKKIVDNAIKALQQ